MAWSGASAAVGLVLWSPMLLQQFTGEQGNLSHLVYLSLDSDRPTMGFGSAVRQIAHVLGLPPLLGKLDLTGADLVASVSPLTWVSAGAVLLTLVGLGLHWRRAPERFSVVSMSAVLIVAGLVNGSSVLDSIEQVRLALYHWVFPLAFFVTLALAMGAIEGVRKAAGRLSSGRLKWTWKQPRFVRPTLAGGTLLLIGVPALVNPTLDRHSNELYAFSATVERSYVEDLINQVMAHRDRFDEPIVLMHRGFRGFSSMRESLALYMVNEGVDVRFPLSARNYVADRRLVDPDHETGALLLVHDTSPDWEEVEVGELIADVLTVENLDSETFDTALDRLRSTGVYRFSPSLRQYFDDFPDEWLDAAERGELQAELEGRDAADFGLADPTEDQIERFWNLTGLDRLHQDPEHYLATPDLLDLLLEHPLEEPELDPDVLREIRESALGSLSPDRPLRLRVYLLDHDELAEIAADDLPSQPSTGDS